MILEMTFLHRASTHPGLTSRPGKEGHGWVWRLLERAPTGQGTMSTVHKVGTDILYPPPPPRYRLIPAPMEQQLHPYGVSRFSLPSR